MNRVKFPNVVVKLVGEEGNAFSIIARVEQAMKKAGIRPEFIENYRNDAFACGSYEELLRLTMKTVRVT